MGDSSPGLEDSEVSSPHLQRALKRSASLPWRPVEKPYVLPFASSAVKETASSVPVYIGSPSRSYSCA